MLPYLASLFREAYVDRESRLEYDRLRSRKYRAANLEAARARNREYRRRMKVESESTGTQKFRKREYTMLVAAKSRAGRKGLEFSITMEDVVIPDKCPILGIYISTKYKLRRGENSPSLDRIDNTKGYVPGNVRVISWRANRLKNDATPEELQLLAQDAARFRPPRLSM